MAKSVVKIMTGKYIAATGIFLALVAGLFFTSGAASAAGGRAALKSPDEIVADLKPLLNLTEDQAAKVRPIIEEHVQKRKAIIQSRKTAGASGGPGAIREEMQKLREETKTKLHGVLSADQMAAFDKYMQEQTQSLRERLRGAGSGTSSGPGYSDQSNG